jgi:hypothetical protein
MTFSLQANYTARVAAAYRRSYCQLLRVGDVAWSARRIPTAVNLGFLDRHYYHHHHYYYYYYYYYYYSVVSCD